LPRGPPRDRMKQISDGPAPACRSLESCSTTAAMPLASHAPAFHESNLQNLGIGIHARPRINPALRKGMYRLILWVSAVKP